MKPAGEHTNTQKPEMKRRRRIFQVTTTREAAIRRVHHVWKTFRHQKMIIDAGEAQQDKLLQTEAAHPPDVFKHLLQNH